MANKPSIRILHIRDDEYMDDVHYININECICIWKNDDQAVRVSLLTSIHTVEAVTRVGIVSRLLSRPSTTNRHGASG